MSETARVPRRRDSEATRHKILEAARRGFSRAPYDQVGLREIASQAGVDVALVARYFGSKEGLFAAALSAATEKEIELPAARAELGEWLVRRFTSRRRNQDPTKLLILHHSVTNPRAAKLIRGMIGDRMISPLAKWLGGEDAELRAALIISHLVGLRLLREVIGLDPLARTDQNGIADHMAPVIQSYVETTG